MSAHIQRHRILVMLRKHPITIAHTDCQPAADGGNKITRLAARIDDLRKKDGHEIGSRRVKLGKSTVAEYFLIREAGAPHAFVGIPEALKALDVPQSFSPAWADRANPYADDDGEEWAA